MRTIIFQIMLLAGTIGSGVVSLQGADTVTPSAASGKLEWTFQHDENGRLKLLRDPGGKETAIQYEMYADKPDLLKTITRRSKAGDVVYEFDRQGRRTGMKDLAGRVSYGYDELGRLNRAERQGAPGVTYSRDTLGRIASIAVGNFYRVEYGYDFLGRLETMKTPAGVIKYEYQTGSGEVIRTLPNGVKTFWQYAPNGELEKITHGYFKNPKDTRYELLAEYTYQYRPDGLIDAIQERSGAGQFVKAYQYDLAGRLVRASGPPGQQFAYTYDAVGNRLTASSAGQITQTCTYDWAGRLTTINGTTCTHDAAGNLTSMVLDGNTLTYSYNHENQLAEALGGKVSYRYDGDGSLISRKTAEAETTFINDPFSDIWQPLVMEEKGGQRTLVVWEGKTPLVMIRDGKPEYLLGDHLRSVRLLIDDKGVVSQRLDYEPFGRITSTVSDNQCMARFAGLFWDSQLHTYLSFVRNYSPILGRFLEIDPQHRVPFDAGNDLTLYLYCGADPVNWVDRNGADREQIEKVSIIWEVRKLVNEGTKTGSFSVLNPNYRKCWEWQDVVYDTLVKNKYDHWEVIPYGEESAKREPLPGQQNFKWPSTLFGIDYGPVFKPIPHYTHFFVVIRSKTDGQMYKIDPWQNKSNFGLEPFKPEKRYIANEFGNPARSPSSPITSSSQSEVFSGSRPSGKSRVYITDADMPQTETSANSMTSMTFRGLDYDGVIKPRIIAYGTTEADANDMARIILKQHPEMNRGQDLIVKSGNLKTEELVKLRRELGADAVLVMRSDPKGTDFGATGKTKPGIAGPSGGRDGGFSSKYWTDSKYKVLRDGNIVDMRVSRLGSGGTAIASANERSVWEVDTSRTRSSGSVSPVGGVYLGGSGALLEGLGLLDGITVDANNNLVLLGKASGEIKLPPVRLDDVVTIFRSVYLHGEGPTVTIDPNPENPEGSAMIIRHSKATENTYVGWVLYQADRLMKSYTLGVDNITTQQVVSVVPGYTDILNTMYFGGSDPRKSQKEGHWERFWIVPAEARRFAGGKNELTLFDVPLKVKTQTMKWEKDKLVDDFTRPSSPGAAAFTNWFTAKYDEIAGERFLTPPPQSGISNPVPVFTELRRIALLTAIAEKLRNEGVPMPFWMQDYEVTPLPFEKFTPAMEVTRTNEHIIARIYGGVELSAADKDVRTFTPSTPVNTLPVPEQIKVRNQLKLADSLEQLVRKQVPTTEPLQVRPFVHQGTTYKALPLPGTETKGLAPCRFEEVDLEVPVDNGPPIRLVRSYNSFFNPAGPWGRGWALELPRLEEVKVPVKRDASSVRMQTAYELVSPLNSTYARFSRIEPVPDLNNVRLQVPDQPGEFLALADGKPDFLSGPTHKVILKQGGAWHFSKDGGHLVAIENGAAKLVYERDNLGRVSRIVGVSGRGPTGHISLRYDKQGRLESAQAEHANVKKDIAYQYAKDGRLEAVISSEGKTSYTYDRGLVKSIGWSEKIAGGKFAETAVIRKFDYAPNGQLLAEADADASVRSCKVEPQANGYRVTMLEEGQPAKADVTVYDGSFRPVEYTSADQSRTRWDYASDGGVKTETTFPDGQFVRTSVSGDRTRKITETSDKVVVQEDFDPRGRPVGVTLNQRPLVKQQWHANGLVKSVDYETHSIIPQYEEFTPTSILQVKPVRSAKYTEWQEAMVDNKGRVKAVKDCTGLDIEVAYHPDGDIAGLITKRDGKNYGLKVTKNAKAQVEQVQSSWGTENYRYDASGLLQQVMITKGTNTAKAEYAEGRLNSLTQFDGGQIRFEYAAGAETNGLLKAIQTPVIRLDYLFSTNGYLTQVDCGKAYRVKYTHDQRGILEKLEMTPIEAREQ